MNEQRNRQVVEEILTAFNRDDLQAVLERLADDVEFHAYGPPEIPYAGVHRGKEGVTRFFELIDQHFEFEKLEPQRYIAQDDAVVVIAEERSRARATGNQIRNPLAFLYTLRDGKVTRVQIFEDTAAIASSLGQRARAAA